MTDEAKGYWIAFGVLGGLMLASSVAGAVVGRRMVKHLERGTARRKTTERAERDRRKRYYLEDELNYYGPYATKEKAKAEKARMEAIDGGRLKLMHLTGPEFRAHERQ